MSPESKRVGFVEEVFLLFTYWIHSLLPMHIIISKRYIGCELMFENIYISYDTEQCAVSASAVMILNRCIVFSCM